MRISRFDDARDNTPLHVELTWDAFSRGLGPHTYYPVSGYSELELDEAKKGLPCFCPAEFLPDTARGKGNVVRLWLFVADMDHLTKPGAQAVCQRLQGAGLAAIVYTSWKHGVMPWRLRVVLPLSRPVDAEDWPDFWEKMNAAFGGICDPKCKDASRIYFGVFAPAGTEGRNFYWTFPGSPIDVDGIIGAARTKQDPERARVIRELGEAWPEDGRHESHLALAGGLLLSGVSNEEAVDILCQVAVTQDPNNEDRPKREATVQSTKDRILRGEKVVAWTTLARHVGPDLALLAQRVLEASPQLSGDQLKHLAKSLKKKRDFESSELGEALEKICEGEVYAQANNRSDITMRLAQLFSEKFEKFDPKSIAELFIPSFLKIGMDTSSCPSVEEVTFAIQRFQKQRKDRRNEQQSEQADRIREAFGSDRTNPYTPAELQLFGAVDKRWIIQHDRAFYLFFNGAYKGPYTEASVANAAARELAPAASAGVQLYTVNKEGERSFKQLKMLVDQYGSVAESIVLDLTAQTTTYHEKSRVIIEAPCPLRPLVPTYHPDVDHWLKILTGLQYENVKTWLAIATRLDLICAALFVVGEASVGKSMLGLGVSRLFGTNGPTSLESVFGNFNGAILNNPIIVADEHLPKDLRGNPMTAELRQLLQRRECNLTRKFLPDTKLLGTQRVIISAHDISILRSNEHLSNNEVQGTSERLLYVPCNPEAARFLASYNTFAAGWVDGDKIAEHALWLRDHHPHRSQGRFYIRSDNEDVVRMLTTGSGTKAALCQFLVSFILNPGAFSNSAEGYLILIESGKLLVNAKGPSLYWETYLGKQERHPSLGILSEAVRELSTGQRLVRRNKHGVSTAYYIIELKNLYSWAHHNGFATQAQIARGLGYQVEEKEDG